MWQMALIYFYDASELDKQQLSDALKNTDHHWEYVEGKIELASCNADAEVISMFTFSSVTREIMEAMPKLKLIACRSTGFDNIDLEAAEARGITVVNVPTYGEETVAEYAFALLLALTRKLPAVLKTKNEQFAMADLCGIDLAGKVFGAIGTGHIGQKALKIADGFSMKTIAYDAFPNDELQDKYHFQYVSLDELLSQADVVSLHVPLLPSTRHIINRERLEKMKPGAILINTARGELVDTKALIDALDSGQISGAGIDVIEGEGLLHHTEEVALLGKQTLAEDVLRHGVEISTLQKMPNVIISPHNAYNTVEAIGRINSTTVQNIIDFWYGNTPNKVKVPPKPMGKLLLTRHAESQWNATGRWTGTRDIPLSDKGYEESSRLGQALRNLGIHIDAAYCSEQSRSRETLEVMLSTAQQLDVDVVASGAINERDYGEYTGKNKWDMKELIGADAFDAIRRGWDVPVPGGETLKMVYERVVPFYVETVLPLLKAGKNVLIVAHGNSLRALIKYLESISDEDVSKLEMMFGQIIIYDVTPDGLSGGSKTVQIESPQPNA